MQIGKRERVQDVRLVWKKENDFSNWLVTDDGINLLADELGIEIENLRRESRPGDFPCDVVGNLLGDENHIVVIENQFGKTNHDHLGKLLTYAAVHKAMTGIWISETISDDHRQVIDWLNDNTPTNINFYLVGLRLYRIGQSPVAPQLDVVCRPNTSVKETKSVLSQADRERQAWRRNMWIGIQESVKAAKPPFRLQRPGDEHWSSIAIGRYGFHLNMLLTPKYESIGIDLYIKVPWKVDAFEALWAQKAAIESELPAPLQWMLLPGKKSGRILLEAKIDPRKPGNEAQVREWFATNTVLMFKAFKNRVAALVEPTGYQSSEDAEVPLGAKSNDEEAED